jgi:hypothetical protein
MVILEWLFRFAVVLVLLVIADALFKIRDALSSRVEGLPAEKERRRAFARKELEEAMDRLQDSKFCEMDRALGTGHGVRRAERILAAKTWDEIEQIVEGEDLETVKEEIAFHRRPL